MNKVEALALMSQGHRVGLVQWDRSYLHFDSNQNIVNENGCKVDINMFPCGTWEAKAAKPKFKVKDTVLVDIESSGIPCFIVGFILAVKGSGNSFGYKVAISQDVSVLRDEKHICSIPESWGK